MHTSYFRVLNGNYYFYLLGKDGEPILNKRIIVDIYNSFLTQPVKFDLKTDNEGKVCLGNISEYTEIEKITCTESYSCSSSIQIKNRVNNLARTLPSKFTILEGEDLILPSYTPNSVITRELYSLYKYQKENFGNIKTSNILSECFDNISADKESEYRLVISDLKYGYYKFVYYETEKIREVEIEVC